MVQVPETAFSLKVLDRELHERLIADIEKVCKIAGTPPFMVWTGMSPYCTPQEINWVSKSLTSEKSGLVLVGLQETPIEDKFMAMTAAYLRNYKDARMLTLQEVLHHIKRDDLPEPTVLLVPNFVLGKNTGGEIPQWQTSGLLGMLYQRMSQGLKTILYIDSMDNLKMNYGASFVDHLSSHYDFL